ncbi:type I secretion system permease/ATPase [Rickettsiales endosymbiont of Stachyamoeba lipophora]|uniref:type I secretion system permease/ATPase n=1 Tax=Rickettsiales endosymbiont of Stachyamoeba lipophora TaxID=2486578 RepID=UPI000F64B30E|nr:type I secretion system permease/ATPase [Rickettsiales endosymbiont of Stachyamoeba lipophora]AZL15366.1 type I secretion system permease/ATPase [Rickettsiales endosymbiont of Stachyamoeba lipophora]
MFSIIFNKIKSNKNPDNLLDNLVRKLKVSFVYCVLYGFVYNLLMLAMSIYSLQVLDRVISSGSTDTLLMLTLVVVGSIMLMVMINFARSLIMQGMASWLDEQLNKQIFTRSVYLTVNNKSNLPSQLFRELENVKSFITGLSLPNLIDAPWAIIFIVILFVIHPINGWLAVLGAGILIGLAIYSERSTKKYFEQANERFIKNMQQMDIVARNSEVVVAMGMMEDLYNFWHKGNHKGNELKSYAQHKSQYFSNITKFMRFIIQISVTGVGGLLVVKGELTSGGMIASSILVGRALAPFESIVASWNNVIISRKAYQKLQNFVEFNPYSSLKTKFPEPKGKIEVNNLFYVHPNTTRQVLKNINFTVNPGEVVGIIGDSAAGKSTLARILVGVWKAAHGEINIDGIDLHKWQHADSGYGLGAYIGYLPQDIELFNGTIKENIARMSKKIDDELVIKAAQIAEVHDMIIKLPDGYDTIIGIEGTSLSGGQKQRVALARAFYGTPKLIVLDEPNANLDKSGEEALFRAISKIKEEKITTMIISHRPSILDVVDKIMIVRDGQILAFDERNKIIKQLSQQS